MVVMDHKMKWLKSRKPLIVLYFPFKTSLYQTMVMEIMFIPCWEFLSTCHFIEEFCCVLRFHIHLGRDINCLYLRDFVFITVLVKSNWLGKFKDQVCITCVRHYLGMVVANYLCHYFILYIPYHLCHYLHMDEENANGHIYPLSSFVTLLFDMSDEF